MPEPDRLDGVMRPPLTPTDPVNDNINISRATMHILVATSIAGWALAFFLIGVLLGNASR